MSQIFPIGGGKGGVGKTFITASLGALLAKHGRRVVLVDLDLGGSNLHTFLGVKDPDSGLDDFLKKRCNNLDYAALPTIIPNLFIISSMNCSLEIANLFHAQKLKIINAIRGLPYDYILLDLGAGTSFNTLDFFLTSNEGIFIFTPEPTSIENTVRFINAAYFRKLKQVLKRSTFNSLVKEFIDQSEDVNIRLTNIVEFVKDGEPDKASLLLSKLSGFNFRFILNEVRNSTSPNLGDNIEKVCNRHFYSTFQFLGNVSYDKRVHDSVFSKTIYITRYSYAPAATDLNRIARKLTENAQDDISQPANLALQ